MGLSRLHLGAFILLLIGCGGSAPDSTSSAGSAAGAEKTFKIAVIPKGTTHVFWKSIHAGAAKAAQELGVEIIWQGPQREDDRNLQIQVVQNFISRGVDAIVLAPLDENALVRPVEAAAERGIKVVIIDSGIKTDAYESFVATDNYAGGKLCAKRLAELMKGEGQAVMLRYMEGSASTDQREKGFLEGLKEYGPNIKLLSDNQYAGATAESALKASQNLLNRFEKIDGIFCPNESSTFGMLRALQIAKLAGKIPFVGFDSSEALIKGMQDHELNGAALQDPFKMGYLGVVTAVEALKGVKVEKHIDTGVVLVLPERLEQPEIKALLNPELDKWLK